MNLKRTCAAIFLFLSLACIAQPVITVQPQPVIASEGAAAALEVSALGVPPISCQWWFNGHKLPGQGTNQLFFASTGFSNSGSYFAVLTDEGGAVTSSVVKLTVVSPVNAPVYTNDFEASIGPEWSVRLSDLTPKASRRFLGQFGNTNVVLSLSNLPPHTEVNLTFDLLIINSWDGNSTIDGPDRWRCLLDGNNLLMDATFSSLSPDDSHQSYPVPWTGGNYRPNSGAAEVQTLGFNWIGLKCDAVYELSFQVPHSSDSLSVSFSAFGLENISNESWGLDNVVISLAAAETNTPPAIVSQPKNQSLPTGATAVFKVCQSALVQPAYQWQLFGTNLSGATLSSFVRPGLQISDSGPYQVVVSNTYGSVTSAPAMLMVSEEPPVMVVQPQDISVQAGSDVYWFGSSSGSEPITHRWHFDGVPIAGATRRALYNQYNVQKANEGLYSVVASNTFGTASSRYARLTVTDAPPSFKTQPVNGVIAATSNATFSVTCAGTEPFSYWWRFNGNDLADGNAPSYSLTNAQPSNVGSYSVVVSNSAGVSTSSPALLAIVIEQPVGQTVNAGGQAVFHVAALGSNLKYQWRFNGTNLAGQTSADLTLSFVGTNQAGKYSVVVREGTASFVSEAELTVPVAGTPGSQKWKYSYPLGIHTTPALAKDGTIYVAANGALISLSASGTENWKLQLKGLLYSSPTLGNDGTIYVGASFTNLLYAVTPSGTLLWQTNLPGVAIYTPCINEDGSILLATSDYPNPSSLVLLESNGALRWRVDMASRPSGCAIGNGAVYAGSGDANLFYSFDQTGHTNWIYPHIWGLWGSPVIASDGSIYAGEYYNPNFRKLSVEGAVLWQKSVSGSTTVNPIVGEDGSVYFSSTTGTLWAYNSTGDLLWSHDLEARTYTGPAISRAGTIYTSADEKKVLAINSSGKRLWEFLTGSQDTHPYEARRPNVVIGEDGTVYFPAIKRGYTGVLYAIQGAAGPAESSWPMHNRNAQHTGRIPFIITNQPADQAVFQGTNAVYTVGVLSTQPCAYQWRHQGSDIPGETTSVLSLTNVQPSLNGRYSCLISNQSGAFVSRQAWMKVLEETDSGDVVIDNPQAELTGGWNSGISAGGKYGRDYYFSENEPGTATATYRPQISAAGDHDIYIWYPQGGNRSTMAPWRISGDVFEGTVMVNQQINGGRWVLIATNVFLEQGTSGFVSSSNVSAGAVIADAVAFVRSSSAKIPPIIYEQPISMVSTAGTTVTLSVKATGSGPLSFQWKKDNVDVFGATTTSVQLERVQRTDAGLYTVLITNLFGKVTSSSARLEVVDIAPAILEQPTSQTLGGCSDLILQARAIGSEPMFYQWQRNAQNIPHAISPVFVLQCAQPIDGGAYRLIVSNNYGAVTSVVSIISVTNAAPWPSGQGRGLSGSYFANRVRTFEGTPALFRIDPTVDFNWMTGSPHPSIYPDRFTARWTGQILPQHDEPYSFRVEFADGITTDDGVRLWIDGQLAIDKWTGGEVAESNPIQLPPDRKADIVLEYWEGEYGASIRLAWSSPTQALQTIPQANLFPDLGPKIMIDGAAPLNDNYLATNSAVVSIESAYANPTIFYSLNGSAPDFQNVYAGPFTVTRSVTIRARAYSPDFSRFSDSRPVRVNIVPSYSLSARSMGGGAVIIDPSQDRYVSNTTAQVTAIPDPGWEFLRWLGDLSGSSPSEELVLNRNKHIEAEFGTPLFTSVTGNGSISIDPSLALYPFGTAVRLTALPFTGSAFTMWGYNASGTTNPLSFTITNPAPSVSSLFSALKPGQYGLSIQSTGRGTVTPSPWANVYSSGASVSLTAVPEPGQSFLGWSGDAAGTQNPLTIGMTQNRLVIANFSELPSLRIESESSAIMQEGCRLQVNGRFGAIYSISASTNLVDWSTLLEFTNTYGRTQYTDTNQFPYRFYRLLH